nr:hypothetical protein [Haladaptatus halobius]
MLDPMAAAARTRLLVAGRTAKMPTNTAGTPKPAVMPASFRGP